MGGECLTSITFTPQWGDVVVAQQMVTVMFDDVRVEIAEPARVAPRGWANCSLTAEARLILLPKSVPIK